MSLKNNASSVVRRYASVVRGSENHRLVLRNSSVRSQSQRVELGYVLLELAPSDELAEGLGNSIPFGV